MKDKKTDKIKKHFDIQIDGEKFKIMNYIISEEPYKALRLITKIRGQKFPQKSIANIEISTPEYNIAVQGKWVTTTTSPILEDWMYEIIE